MAKECFCGCGVDVPFGRRRVANALGDRIDKDLALFRGVLDQGAAVDHQAELSELVATGGPLRDGLRDVVHGILDRKQFDRAAGRAWMERAQTHRKRLAMETARGDYAGWNGMEQAELVHGGRRAAAVVVDVADTGMTLNNDPRVLVRLQVQPADGGSPFELERKVVVSRVAIPRPGERVEVFYDPEDHERFTFRLADLADDAAADAASSGRLDQLAKLGELRAAGVLTDDEFAAEKARILAAD